MKKAKNWLLNGILCGIILFIFFHLVHTHYETKKLLNSNRVKYAIGNIFKISSGRSTGRILHYYYYYKNKKIEGVELNNINTYMKRNKIKKLDSFLGKRYLVKFSIIDSTRSDLLLRYPVPDYKIIQPKKAWDSIPYFMKQNYIIYY
ncbi:hypothetical protein SAMN05444411_1173 [Lutibacter oricola]|uniref:Uncharacterized protein n=1 Tax=Lutibacter oricola TaxID=762486 RepID=A0A1H3GRT4_9FLAO|nr:hypothetical protein [Lutibacter oricola]SDY06042.1 hypothetical protein SAMN05444411_1173 [Lutibacter oricola]